MANPAGGPQLTNQVLANTGAAAQQLAGVDGVAIDSVVDIEFPANAAFRTLANPFRPGGECRHILHCHGSERGVRRNGKYKCITLSVCLRQAGLRQGWSVACTSVFTCCAVPQR